MLDGGLDFLNLLRIGVDVTLVWYILYKLIMLIRGTKAIQLLKGIVVVLAVWLFSSFFELHTIQYITNKAIEWGIVVIVILFQPELRRALEQIGRGNIFSRGSKSEEEILEQKIEAIVQSCTYMAKRRIGALISIERETGIGEYAETGIAINANLSHQLLTNIFTPNTPLHDGAVIIKDEEIMAAACYLPLSESPFISKELGTRHRAAMGISEVTDAITIVVSEETGNVSCTKNGELKRELDKEDLRKYLRENLSISLRAPESKSSNQRGKENG